MFLESQYKLKETNTVDHVAPVGMDEHPLVHKPPTTGAKGCWLSTVSLLDSPTS